MELALSLAASLGIGGGTAAAGAAGVAGAAGGSSLLLNIAQGTLTAFSAAASIGAGFAAKGQARIEEISAGMEADREKIAADDEAIRINRAAAEVIGDQAAAYAAGGVDLSSGTPVVARQKARERANEDLQVNRANRNAAVAAWNQRALAARARGNAAVAQGFVGAATDIAGFGMDVAKRGGPVDPLSPRARKAIRQGNPGLY